MLESGIFVEDIHTLPLREDHSNGTVLEDQSGFALQHNAHLLVEL